MRVAVARWSAPSAILLSLVALYSAPEVGGFALAALFCWGLALGFERD